MAKRIRRPRSGARTDTYLKAAKELSVYAPKLKKFRTRKTLTPSEKSQISRYISKIGRTTGNLYPLSKEEQKVTPKSEWVSPSIPAIKINQLDKGSTRKQARKGAIEVTEKTEKGTRKWIFWSIDKSLTRGIPKTDPFGRIERLVNMAFDIYNVKQMHLWNTQGIAGFGYGTPEQFFAHYSASLQPGRIGSGGATIPRAADEWLLGIAFLVEE